MELKEAKTHAQNMLYSFDRTPLFSELDKASYFNYKKIAPADQLEVMQFVRGELFNKDSYNQHYVVNIETNEVMDVITCRRIDTAREFVSRHIGYIYNEHYSYAVCYAGEYLKFDSCPEKLKEFTIPKNTNNNQRGGIVHRLRGGRYELEAIKAQELVHYNYATGGAGVSEYEMRRELKYGDFSCFDIKETFHIMKDIAEKIIATETKSYSCPKVFCVTARRGLFNRKVLLDRIMATSLEDAKKVAAKAAYPLVKSDVEVILTNSFKLLTKEIKV